MKRISLQSGHVPPRRLSKLINLLCVLSITGALSFLLYYHVIQSAISEHAMDKYRDLYHTSTERLVTNDITEEPELESEAETLPGSGTLASLQSSNPDIQGWITIPGTNIDYPVIQAADSDRQSYYLAHNPDGTADKNGSLIIDYRTPLSSTSRNIVINGHNMKSTGLMFRELINYNSLDFYQQHPVLTFHTASGNDQWKIFALIKTNNNENHGARFIYYRDDFASDFDFLEFIYQLELRSIYSYPVSVNENDTLLILSTCTYEMDDMRLLVVARRIRSGESTDVDTASSFEKKYVLYPDAWYDLYTATRPEVTSFKDAYRAGELTWYDGTISFH